MKNMRKISSLLLALVMMMSLAFTTFAANNGSITINGTTEGKIYDLYKIFDLTLSDSDNDEKADKFSYTIDRDWVKFFNDAGKKYIVDSYTDNLNAIIVESGEDNAVTKYIDITDDNVANFSQDALAYISKADADRSVTAGGETVTVDGLELGYYLVYPQGATDIKDGYACLCSLTSTEPNAEVEVKATYPEIEKTDDDDSVEVGQTVNYTITGQVPDTTGYDTYEYTITDSMSDGLTFNKDVKVKFGETEIEITVSSDNADSNSDAYVDYTEDNKFALKFDMASYQEYKGQEIEVTYSAVVNKAAVSRVEKNSATLTYSNDPSDSTNTVTTPPAEEKVFSAKIVIDKYDANNPNLKLAGAKFVLKKGQNLYYATAANATEADPHNWKVTWVDSLDKAAQIVTDEKGAAVFEGLADGSYKLEEIEAPAGYNLLDKDIDVTVENDETKLTVTAKVENNSGTLLPITGGMGTMIFYAFGGVLVLAAMVLLVVKSRIKVDN